MQAAAAKLQREAGSVPGHWPGIYGCEYKNLSSIYVHTAKARLAALQGNLTVAEVLSCSTTCLQHGASHDPLLAYIVEQH